MLGATTHPDSTLTRVSKTESSDSDSSLKINFGAKTSYSDFTLNIKVQRLIEIKPSPLFLRSNPLTQTHPHNLDCILSKILNHKTQFLRPNPDTHTTRLKTNNQFRCKYLPLWWSTHHLSPCWLLLDASCPRRNECPPCFVESI